MNAVLRRRLLALLFASCLLAVACAPDSRDAGSDTDDMPETTDEAQPEPEAPDAEAPAPEDDTDDDAAPDDDAEPSEAEPAVELDPPADLGAFNDYDPTDPDATLLPVDDEVLIGQLDNGFSYYLRSNDSPGESVVIYLAIDAGGLVDPPEARGAAHFLEHMLFNGTEEYSKNELDQVLRDIGTEFGADLNAYTSADETVYILDFKLDDPEALDLAFSVLSQWASAATLLSEDVEDERGIVIDEHRLRDESAAGRIGAAIDELYYLGTVYEGLQIGGTEESNATVTPEQLREYYDTWYRPDNMAVVVVGDFDVSDVRARVETGFADFVPRSAELADQPERHPFTAEFAAEPLARVATHPDHGSIYVSLDWQLPAWPSGTAGGERLRFSEEVIVRMLDVRLDAAFQAGLLAQTTEPHLSTFSAARALRFIGTNYQGPDLAAATTDYISVVEGAARWGFTQSELEQVAAAVRTSFDFQLDSEATTQDAEYASDYLGHFLGGSDISSTNDQVARQRALLDSFTVAELTAHLRWLLDRAAPILVSIGPDPAQVPTADELIAAVAAVIPIAAPAEEDSVETLLRPPPAVAPTSESVLGLFEDAYEWKFANGTTVVFVPSDIAAGEVNVIAEGLGGWSTLSPGDSALARHAVAAVVASGLGPASATQLDEFLAATTARVSPFIAEFSEGFSGAAGTDDLETLFSMLHLYITAPRMTDVALGEQVQAMESRLANSETIPQWISELALLDAQYQGSEWHQFVASREQIDATTKSSLLGLYNARLSDVDDLMVAVVGDIDRDAVKNLAARYIGSLPRGVSDTYVNRQPPFPSSVKRIDIAVDADAGASGFDILFGAEVPISTKSLVIADVAKAILDDLLVTNVREELGDAYSVYPSISANEATGTWNSRISSTGGSEGLELGHARILEIISELVADGPTERDLEQAISVLRDDYALESNSLILNPLLARLHLDDEDVGTPSQRRAALQEVTAEQVRQHIALFFDLDNRIEVFRSAE